MSWWREISKKYLPEGVYLTPSHSTGWKLTVNVPDVEGIGRILVEHADKNPTIYWKGLGRKFRI